MAFNPEKCPDYPERGKYARQLSGAGGQHRPPQGVSTFDDETSAERRERHRRAYAKLGEPSPFDIDSAPNAEPRAAATESDLADLERFNRELQAAIDASDWSQPF